MPKFRRFFRCVGEAIMAKGLKGLAGLVPFGEHLWDIAALSTGSRPSSAVARRAAEAGLSLGEPNASPVSRRGLLRGTSSGAWTSGGIQGR